MSGQQTLTGTPSHHNGDTFDDTLSFGSEYDDIVTRYIPCPRFSRWTFSCDVIREWVQHHTVGRTLNACAGKTQITHDGEVRRNDVNTQRDADTHVDVAAVAREYEEASFDTIIYDPPWSVYQSNLRYNGHNVQKNGDVADVDIDITTLPFEVPSPEEKTQIGHARLAKEGFDYLLGDAGRVIELTFHGTCMPARMGFDKRERVVFDPIGEGKAVIGSVDVRAE